MKSFIRATLLATAIMFSGPAFAWDLDKMNEQIEQTNVIVSGICSGTIIDKDQRLVLTAHHCITDNLREVEKKEVDPVTGEIKTTRVMERTPMYVEVLKRQDFEVVASVSHRVEIKGWDDRADIAILQVKDADWKPPMAAPLASDFYQYQRGRKVYAVGNPGIAYDNSLSDGIISAPERSINLGRGYVSLFQHTAMTIGGSSGGAIYNDDGEIIGTVSAGVRGANIGFAVPISKTKELLKRLGLVK
jgi:S1-C subfamily serine protease